MVPRNAQQERVDGAALLVVVTCFTHQHHKHFMGYVFGHFSRATHVQGEAINIRLSTTVKLGKRFAVAANDQRSEEHTSELQSLRHLVCRLLLEKKKTKKNNYNTP